MRRPYLFYKPEVSNLPFSLCRYLQTGKKKRRSFPEKISFISIRFCRLFRAIKIFNFLAKKMRRLKTAVSVPDRKEAMFFSFRYTASAFTYRRKKTISAVLVMLCLIKRNVWIKYFLQTFGKSLPEIRFVFVKIFYPYGAAA